MIGPNELLPCGTEDARRRHAAHGEICAVCDATTDPTPVLCHQCGSSDRPAVVAFVQHLEQTITGLTVTIRQLGKRLDRTETLNAERAAQLAAATAELQQKTAQLAAARREIKQLSGWLATVDAAFEALLRVPVIRHEAVERARRAVTEAHPTTHEGVAA